MTGVNELQYPRVNFKKDRVLTASMLDIIQSKSEMIWEQFRNAPDGILEGLDVVRNERGPELTSGAVKVGGQVYLLCENADIAGLMKSAELTEGRTYSLVVKASEPVRTEESIVVMNASLEFDEQPSEKAVEIGKFRYAGDFAYSLYSNDAGDAAEKLRQTLDADTFFSIAVFSHAINGGRTFPPLIFGLMDECLSSKENKTEFEYSLLMAIRKDGILPLGVLELYIERYTGRMTEKTPDAYISGFLEALRRAKERAYVIADDRKEPPAENAGMGRAIHF